MSKEKIICGCLNITEKQIVNAVENGLTTVKKIGEVIESGTICGNCKDRIQEVIYKAKPKEKIVCRCYKITEEEIVKAIKNGATTVDSIGNITRAGTGCGKCKEKIQEIIDNTDKVICGCLNITEKRIINAVENGATTIEEVAKETKATTICGACKASVQEVIDKAKPKEKIVCRCYKITEEEIVKAIKNGATTVDSIGNITRAGTGCGKCKETIQEIIDSTDKVICGCLNITEKRIINVVENGARTLKEVEKATKASTICGACKVSVQEVIDKAKPKQIIDKTKPQENTTVELYKEIDNEIINEIEPKDENVKLESKKNKDSEIKKVKEKEKNKSFLGKVKNIFK